MPSLRRWALAALLPLALGCAADPDTPAPAPHVAPPGTTTPVPPPPDDPPPYHPRTINDGAFIVRLSEDARRIQVVHTAEPERVLWETVPGSDFLRVAVGKEQVDSGRGCFTFHDTIDASCGDAAIDGLDPDGDGFVAHGSLDECGARWEIRFTPESPVQLGFEVKVTPAQGEHYNRAYLSYASTAEESFFGFGHQYSVLDMKGRRLPIWSGEQGIGRGQQPISDVLSLVGGGCAGDWSTTYTAVPAYLTNQGHALAVENTEYLTFDFTENDRVTLEVWSSAIRGRILRGKTPEDAVTALTEYTGRMGPLPAWTQEGALLRTRGGSESARQALREAKAAGARIAALWVEDWCGERSTAFGYRMLWNWDVDRDLYPDWEALVSEVNAGGTRVLIYFNPFLADPSGWSPRRNLYAEARDQGLLVTHQDGTIYPVGNGGFEAGMVDLTNPAARTFIKDVMKAQLAIGVSGWMADFGEALPYDAKLFSGDAPEAFHNDYPYAWAALNREVLKEAGREADGLFFNRSGNARSPGQTRAFWIGDQNTTWDANDGMKTVIPALLSGGMSGYAIDHMDIGGWLSITIPLIRFTRTKELEERWLELGAFGGLYRLHHTNKPDDNWQYNSDAETMHLFVRMTRLFAALAPYRAKLMAESAERGLPLIRHPLLEFPDDPKAYGLTEQFMLGSELMVAPVVDQGKTSVDVYLPAGEWVHAWTGTVYGRSDAGQEVTVPAPIGEPPLLYRRGSAEGEALVSRMRAEGLL